MIIYCNVWYRLILCALKHYICIRQKYKLKEGKWIKEFRVPLMSSEAPFVFILYILR